MLQLLLLLWVMMQLLLLLLLQVVLHQGIVVCNDGGFIITTAQASIFCRYHASLSAISLGNCYCWLCYAQMGKDSQVMHKLEI